MSHDQNEETYRKHADELLRFATGLVGPGDAFDVFQEAFLRAVGSRTWPSVRNRRAYLYRCVLNEARVFLRSSARRRAREGHARQDQALAEHNLYPEVRVLIDRLSVRQRAVILLTYWSDLDPPAIGSLLGISEGAVHRHLSRGRARLRERISNDNG